MKEFGNEYRCIAFDLRNAPPGQSSGPLEIDRPWDSHTDDQLALMDHLGIDKFMVLGFCIGGPLIWNLLKRAPDRVVAGVLAMPSGSRPEMRDLFYDNNMKGWALELTRKSSAHCLEIPLVIKHLDGATSQSCRGGYSAPPLPDSRTYRTNSILGE